MLAFSQMGALTIPPLVALVVGLLILVLPRFLNYLVAIYLIVAGSVTLWPHLLSYHI